MYVEYLKINTSFKYSNIRPAVGNLGPGGSNLMARVLVIVIQMDPPDFGVKLMLNINIFSTIII